jgi:hypothetical protein
MKLTSLFNLTLISLVPCWFGGMHAASTPVKQSLTAKLLAQAQDLKARLEQPTIQFTEALQVYKENIKILKQAIELTSYKEDFEKSFTAIQTAIRENFFQKCIQNFTNKNGELDLQQVGNIMCNNKFYTLNVRPLGEHTFYKIDLGFYGILDCIRKRNLTFTNQQNSVYDYAHIQLLDNDQRFFGFPSHRSPDEASEKVQREQEEQQQRELEAVARVLEKAQRKEKLEQERKAALEKEEQQQREREQAQRDQQALQWISKLSAPVVTSETIDAATTFHDTNLYILHKSSNSFKQLQMAIIAANYHTAQAQRQEKLEQERKAALAKEKLAREAAFTPPPSFLQLNIPPLPNPMQLGQRRVASAQPEPEDAFGVLEAQGFQFPAPAQPKNMFTKAKNFFSAHRWVTYALVGAAAIYGGYRWYRHINVSKLARTAGKWA